MKNTCDFSVDLLSAYLDGECTSEEEQAVRSHLRVCAECSDLVHRFQTNSELTKQAFATELPDSLHEDIMKSVREVRGKHKRRFPHFSGRWSTAVAAAALLVCAFGSVFAYANAQNRLWAIRNSSNRAMPTQDGFVYDMQTQWHGSSDVFSMPKNLELFHEGENLWSSAESAEVRWILRVDAENKTAVLGNSFIQWDGVAVFSENGSLSEVRFETLVYRVEQTANGLCLRLMDA